MIVYGDPQFRASASKFVAALRMRAAQTDISSIDELRTLLIAAGQLEQALADYAPSSAAQAAATITDFAAAGFYTAFADGNPTLPPPQMSVTEALRCFLQVVESSVWPDSMLDFKVPEGFAFYCLFPEQHCLAALRWAQEHDCGDKDVLIVGIRSIGTTLSAVVKQTLYAAGANPQRLTVRPNGDPFDRRTALPALMRTPAFALIVDEGPGLSGSSMASVASALVEFGLFPEQVFFLPGHGNPPGNAANDNVRLWWQRTARYSVEASAIRWCGRSLEQELIKESATRTGLQVDAVQDFCGGQWRQLVDGDDALWAAVPIPFEPAKFACCFAGQPCVLWKFAGLTLTPALDRTAAKRQLARIERCASAGWTPAPTGLFRGLVGTRWIDGTPLQLGDASEGVLRKIGQYVAFSAGAPLEQGEASDALLRLKQMLVANCREALGSKAADRAQDFSNSIGVEEAVPSYTDGRMAPHQWLLTPDGRFQKTGVGGRELDHTMVGRQSVYWDIGGAMAEWNLTLATAQPLLAALRESGLHVASQTLNFYGMAYSAFRLGQFYVCRHLHSIDAAEAQRMLAAEQYFRRRLERLLSDCGQ